MKTIGVIGGTSWESTVTYYQELNRLVKERLGGLHSAKCVLHSVDFHGVEACMGRGDWPGAARVLSAAAVSLERAGADFFLIASNTLHSVAPAVQAAVSIPLLHIADATADALEWKGVRSVGLLGTKYTMEQDFYRKRLESRGFVVLVPGAEDRTRLNDVIFNELCLGTIRRESREFLLACVESLGRAGAEGVIFGCTELGMLAGEGDAELPLFDTTLIHARSAVLLALDGGAG